MSADFFRKIKELIHAEKQKELTEFICRHKGTEVAKDDFFKFVDTFHPEYINKLSGSININGMGGSRIPKLNISSLLCLYVAAITQKNIVKTGSVSRTGLNGSSDFFEQIGLLNMENKIQAFEKNHFCYFDYTQLAPWKKYKKELCAHQCIKKIWENCLFFEYPESIYGLGLSDKKQQDILNNESYFRPANIFTFYTQTTQGVLDEIAQGDIFLNGNFLCHIPGKMYIPTNRTDLRNENLNLLNGTSKNLSALNSLKYSVAVMLYALSYASSVKDGCDLFENAYDRKLAFHLVRKMRER